MGEETPGWIAKGFEALNDRLKRLEAMLEKLTKPEKAKPKAKAEAVKIKEPEFIECPTCGQLARTSKIREKLGKPVLIREVVKEVPKERIVEKPVEKVVEKPIKVDFKKLVEERFKPRSLTKEQVEVISRIYEALRERGVAE